VGVTLPTVVITVAPCSNFTSQHERVDVIKCGASVDDFVAEVHDRMPMLLKPEQFDYWLSGKTGVEELKPVLFATMARVQAGQQL